MFYESSIENGTTFYGSEIVNDMERLKKESDVIIANRFDGCLNNVKRKVYTRDLFGGD